MFLILSSFIHILEKNLNRSKFSHSITSLGSLHLSILLSHFIQPQLHTIPMMFWSNSDDVPVRFWRASTVNNDNKFAIKPFSWRILLLLLHEEFGISFSFSISNNRPSQTLIWCRNSRKRSNSGSTTSTAACSPPEHHSQARSTSTAPSLLSTKVLEFRIWCS